MTYILHFFLEIAMYEEMCILHIHMYLHDTATPLSICTDIQACKIVHARYIHTSL